MQILICPGIHSPGLTEQFVNALPNRLAQALIVPVDCPAYSGGHILAFLLQHVGSPPRSTEPGSNPIQFLPLMPILLIGFSAGVVGAITAAHLWRSLGGQIVALIAIDGWGVPLFAPFPIHRVSHDSFTHWSSSILGAGQAGFYADPAVAHLDLWRSPQTVLGWSVQPASTVRTTAAHFLDRWIHNYQTANINDSLKSSASIRATDAGNILF
jgi:hypothetical protein